MYRKNKNTNIQTNFFNRLLTLPKYLTDSLEKSYFNTFRDKIFPLINEDRFSVLYSDNPASRPNTPVNVIIGLMTLKEINDLSDEGVISSIYFDIRYQYALWTENYEEQPASINTLTNFRRRLAEYEKETGIDLIKEENKHLALLMQNYLKIDGKTLRMDSMMISSNCKKMSRLELVYSVIEKHLRELKKVNEKLILKKYKVYLEENYYKETIYRIHNNELDSKLSILFSHAYEIYQNGLKHDEIKALETFKLLARLLEEQTIINGEKYEIKPGKEITPDSLQSATDPDATFRKKYGNNVGYVGNIIESIDSEVDEEKRTTNSVILNYDFKQNTYSDSKFMKDFLKSDIAKDGNKKEMLTDGAYFDQELHNQVEEQDVDVYYSNIVGRKPEEGKLGFDEFEIDNETKQIVKCPNQKAPIRSSFKDGVFSAHFKKTDCESCPFSKECPMKKQKKENVVRFSESRLKTSKIRNAMSTKEYKLKTNRRSGIEGIPSVLRRKYSVDKMPAMGLVRSKMHFGFKILAYNIKKLHKGVIEMA
jgi:hypothetical protein